MVTFLYTNRKQSENEINICHLQEYQKKKHIGINLTEEVLKVIH